jgi:two-component system LytT family response regulator
MMKRTTTLIAEDEPLASEGLADWVRQLPELELVGVRADGPGTLQALRELAPELVLMDIHTGDERAAGAARPRRRRASAADGDLHHRLRRACGRGFEAARRGRLLLKPFSQERASSKAVRHALQTSARDAALPALAAASQAGQPLHGSWCATAARSFL